MLTLRLSLILLFLEISAVRAQYISRSEPVPYDCPSVCAGGSLILKVNQIHNFSSGIQIQAQLSNSGGGFSSLTSNLTTVKYSLNNGNSWVNGPFVFQSNVNDVLLDVLIPAAQTPGINYTIRMISSSGYISNDLFQCGSNNKIKVTPSYSPLAAVPSSTITTNQWIAHAYTWVPSTSQIINTPALIAAQSFFNPINYKGHFLKNSLNFDLNFTASAGKMPGQISITHDGTSFSCGEGYATNFSLRFYRTEVFDPGFYRFDIAGDDGIRLSIDGGNTWILDRFVEQSYAQSQATTNTQNPNGICLSGTTNLVIEYFQRPVDSRVTFTCTLLSAPFSEIFPLQICEGESTSFSIGTFSGASYQWQMSSDGGNTFTNIVDNNYYSNTNSSTLTISNIPVDFNNNVYNCIITGFCNNPLNSDTAVLQVLSEAKINKSPADVNTCGNTQVSFSIDATGTSSYQWEYSTDNGLTFTPIIIDSLFYNGNSQVLSINPVSEQLNGFLFRCLVQGCSSIKYSDAAALTINEKSVEDFIPNVFTPNGDEINDFFEIKFDGLSNISGEIYNRWGEQVYSWYGIPHWDGMYNGKAVTAGIYFYQLKAESECDKTVFEKKGYLSLLRD
jgi:gliding motility-associated-like protein